MRAIVTSLYLTVAIQAFTVTQSEKLSCSKECGKHESCVELSKCPHNFRSIQEFVSKNCGIGQVCCNTKENPCSIFPDNGLLLYPPDMTCHEPLTVGACPADQWLVTTGDNTLSCQPKPCPEKQVLYEGVCQDGTDEGPVCTEIGQLWVLAPSGEALCVCHEDYLRGADGKCYVEFTRGNCEGNSIIREVNGKAACVQNPCGDPALSLPHYSSLKHGTRMLKDIACYNATLVDEKNCVTEIDEDDEDMLHCRFETDEGDIIGSRSKCRNRKGRKRVWCETREKCVRVYG